MSHAGSLLNTTGCGVFAFGAISELRGFPDMDNLKNHPLEWIKHLSEKKKKEKKSYPASQNLAPHQKSAIGRSLTFRQGRGEKNKKEKQEKNKSNMVSMLFREYEFRLRTASSCLLLKYVNSVFVLHLQLQQHQAKLLSSFCTSFTVVLIHNSKSFKHFWGNF